MTEERGNFSGSRRPTARAMGNAAGPCWPTAQCSTRLDSDTFTQHFVPVAGVALAGKFKCHRRTVRFALERDDGALGAPAVARVPELAFLGCGVAVAFCY